MHHIAKMSLHTIDDYFSNILSSISKIVRDSTLTVTFGKYKNKTYYQVYCDYKYKQWLLTRNPSTISMINLQEYCKKMDLLKNIY